MYYKQPGVEMTLKYKFNLKDINLEDFKVYLFSLFKAFLPKKKLKILKTLQNLFKKNHHGFPRLHYIII